MKLAVVSAPQRGRTDQLLSEVAATLQKEGAQVFGAVKMFDDATPDVPGCDMNLRVLPDGPVIRITQSLGAGASACKLNPFALSEVVSATEQKDARSFDLMILNKFGPQESEGRGFCAAIGDALEKEIPVIVGVGPGCRDAFDTYAAGLAEVLSPEPSAIISWCRNAISTGS